MGRICPICECVWGSCPHSYEEVLREQSKEKMMSEKRCKDCRFWENTFYHDKNLEPRGWCVSECFNRSLIATTTNIKTLSSFGCVHWQQRELDLREELAKYAHEAWSGWMEHLFDKSPLNPTGTATIPLGYVEGWWRQMRTDYANLSEEEKDSDRAEADRIMAIFEKCQQKGDSDE